MNLPIKVKSMMEMKTLNLKRTKIKEGIQNCNGDFKDLHLHQKELIELFTINPINFMDARRKRLKIIKNSNKKVQM